MKKTNLIISIIIITFLIISSCGDKTNDVENTENEKRKKESEIAEKYKCISCEDCLSKYEFEGARAYLALSDWREANFRQEITVIIAESNYWVKQKDYERALNIVDEFHNDMAEREKQKIKHDVLSKIIDDFISIKDYEKAKLFALKASDNINLDGENKAENPSAWDEVSEMKNWKSQQKDLLEKINLAEKLFH
jgi:hypothetical protein